jgi:phage/plasmid-associated DNA primase
MLEEWNDKLTLESIDKIKQFIINTMNGVKQNKALVFYSTGSRGKTTLVNEIIEIIGSENSEKLSNIRTSRDKLVGLAKCVNKKLIVFDEYQNNNDLLIKQIIGNETVLYENLNENKKEIKLKGNVILVTNNNPETFETELKMICDVVTF